MLSKQDSIALATCLGGVVATYQIYRYLSKHCCNRNISEWIPVGSVKELYIYPVKSCKGKRVFSLYCDPLGAKQLENRDRMFLVVDPNGHFFTARGKPQLVLVNTNVADGKLHVTYNDTTADVDIEEVLKNKKLVNSTLHGNLRQDGYDCGDEAAKFFTNVLGEEARLVMFTPGLFTERTCNTDSGWWKNPVPKRTDDAYFVDLAPFMITTQESLDDVNEKLGRSDNPIPNVQFRGNIIIDKCGTPWSEDRWAEIRFGNAKDSTTLQCFKPCTRCIMTTVDPSTGEKDPAQQPLKKLKEYRMVDDILPALGPSPIFGVNTGVSRPGFVHEGQVVWARLKPTPF